MPYIKIMAYIYRHIRLDKDEVFYIGIGSDDKGKFKRAYSKDRNKYWTNIVDNTEYMVEIILDNLTWEEACEKEKEFIKLYGRKNLKEGTLVNFTDGGEGKLNVIVSSETKEKISKANKGKKTRLGKKHSLESREKMSKIIKKKTTNETKNKLREITSSLIWINNGISNKRVSNDKLEYFLNNNWVTGRTSNGCKGLIHIKLKNQTKMISPKLLEKYLIDGWELGKYYSQQHLHNLKEGIKLKHNKK